jgi:hypothetical protein
MRSGSGRCTRSKIASTRRLRSAAPSVVCWRSTSSTWSPQRSTGLSAVIGSWNTMPMATPRSWRRRAAGSCSRSCPCSAMRPPTARRPGASRPMMVWAMTDLPEPDSPSRQTVRPACTSKLMPCTALTRSAPGGSATVRSRTDNTGVARGGVFVACMFRPPAC